MARNVFDEMLSESGVRVIYGARVASAQKVGTVVTSLTLTTGTTVRARVFIEASYEGDLLAAARVSTTIGRESVAHHCESLAGVRAGTMGVQPAVGLLAPAFACHLPFSPRHTSC